MAIWLYATTQDEGGEEYIHETGVVEIQTSKQLDRRTQLISGSYIATPFESGEEYINPLCTNGISQKV